MTPLRFLLALVFLGTRNFFGNRLRELVPPFAACLNNFHQSILDFFWSEILRVIKPVNNQATDIILIKENGGLIPFETVREKRGLLLSWPISRGKKTNSD